MIFATCLALGLGLGICAIIIACETSKENNGSRRRHPSRRRHQSRRDSLGRRSSSTQVQWEDIWDVPTRPSLPPPLPPRVNVDVPRIPVNPTYTPTGRNGSVPPPLPPRRGGGQNRLATAHSPGFRGIRPEQFPCCPICKARNIAGQPQRIVWHENEDKYCCNRGHEFKHNGKPL